MKLQRTLFIGITGVFFAIGIAGFQASAQCDLDPVEINVLRGGSPTVTVGVDETKNITAKARLRKGTVEPGTTIKTTLKITAEDTTGVIHYMTRSPYFLEIGKGGTGDTFAMRTDRCDGGLIYFTAEFYDDSGLCESEPRTITKTCKYPRN